MNIYRSHNCDELRKKDVGKKVLLSGWINKKRDHGNLLFVDLRDNYGITQCIIDKENPNFSVLEKMQLETVIKIDGKVVNRSNETINKEINTGEVEVVVKNYGKRINNLCPPTRPAGAAPAPSAPPDPFCLGLRPGADLW